MKSNEAVAYLKLLKLKPGSEKQTYLTGQFDMEIKSSTVAHKSSDPRVADCDDQSSRAFDRDAFSVADLSFEYGSLRVWENVCFELKHGQIAFLVGANGSGKSTLLRCLAGWTPPETGNIRLFREDFPESRRGQRTQVFFVPDAPAFYDDLTADEHIDFLIKANRREHQRPAFEHLLHDFELEAVRAHYPSTYSRGMREKLALVLALGLEADVLLLDEPYGPLDSNAASRLSKELKNAADSGAAIIVSCHRPIQGLVPDQVFHLHDGSLDVVEAAQLKQIWRDTEADLAQD